MLIVKGERGGERFDSGLYFVFSQDLAGRGV